MKASAGDGRIWMWLDVALVALIALACVAAVHFRRAAGAEPGHVWMLFPVGLLCWLSGRRFRPGPAIKAALVWGAVFLFLMAAYAYRWELLVAGVWALAALH